MWQPKLMENFLKVHHTDEEEIWKVCSVKMLLKLNQSQSILRKKGGEFDKENGGYSRINKEQVWLSCVKLSTNF